MAYGHEVDDLPRCILGFQVWGPAQIDLLIDAGVVAAIPDSTWNLQGCKHDQADGAKCCQYRVGVGTHHFALAQFLSVVLVAHGQELLVAPSSQVRVSAACANENGLATDQLCQPIPLSQ